jgi:hypothetical protein
MRACYSGIDVIQLEEPNTEHLQPKLLTSVIAMYLCRWPNDELST